MEQWRQASPMQMSWCWRFTTGKQKSRNHSTFSPQFIWTGGVEKAGAKRIWIAHALSLSPTEQSCRVLVTLLCLTYTHSLVQPDAPSSCLPLQNSAVQVSVVCNAVTAHHGLGPYSEPIPTHHLQRKEFGNYIKTTFIKIPPSMSPRYF